MRIQKQSQLTGKIHIMEILLTEEQFSRIQAGKETIQDICPELSDDEREFLISGITPEEWDKFIE